MSPLSDHLDNTGRRSLDQNERYFPPLMYAETKEPYSGNPKRILFSDGIRYFDSLGAELVPSDPPTYTERDLQQAEALNFLIEPYRGLNGPNRAEQITWDNFNMSLEEVKEYLKVEHDLEDVTLQEMTQAAIENAKIIVNRSYENVPAVIRLAIKKVIAFWYENRSEMNQIPAEAEEIFYRYRRNPGL